VFPTEGVKNMSVDKNELTAVDSIARRETFGQKDPYQKILDYHVGEILLTTIIFGVILLLRLHH
jgi:hypothetical protein